MLQLDDEPPGASPLAARLAAAVVARLQGFPGSWQIAGRKTAAYRQVGNAFPPPVARGLGAAIASALTCGSPGSAPGIRPGTASGSHQQAASAARAMRPPGEQIGPYWRMVDCMDKRKVTFLLPAHTMDAARTVVAGGNMSAFVDRALRNETLRAQLATSALPEVSGWLDDAEADQAATA